MQFYRDANGTFHRTQAEVKATKLKWEAVDIPTDHKGLCEVLNALQPPVEFLPQIRALLSGGAPTIQMVDEIPPLLGEGMEEDLGLHFDPSVYKEGQPTKIFLGSRDPLAVFTCTACGKNNSNQAKSTNGPV